MTTCFGVLCLPTRASRGEGGGKLVRFGQESPALRPEKKSFFFYFFFFPPQSEVELALFLAFLSVCLSGPPFFALKRGANNGLVFGILFAI